MNEVIELGKHRLLCGDATKKDDVDKLIGEDEVNLLLTDPPYGIDIVKTNSDGGGGAVGHQGGPAVTPFKDKRINRRGKTSNIQEKRERERERANVGKIGGQGGPAIRPFRNSRNTCKVRIQHTHTHTHQMMELSRQDNTKQ